MGPDPGIVEVEPEAGLDAVFNDVMVPSFPPSELGTVEGLRSGIAAGTTSVLVALDEADRPLATAVGDWSPSTGVGVLSYLAVRPGIRASGLGGRLLTRAVADWEARWQPAMILAEIEHPAAYAGSEAYGDPTARVRFYARHGVRPLELPFFQPALRAGLPRAYDLMLCVLSLTDRGRGAEPDTVDGDAVHRWLVEYLEATEGSVPDDAPTRVMLEATRRPGGVRILSMDELSEVPRSVEPT